jgi:SAM-dependent methyltransferase
VDVTAHWTDDFFDDPYTELHPFPDAKHTDAEVEALVRLLPAQPARLLDVACGQGRHAIRLAGRGYDVVGIDTSPEFLAMARASTDADIQFIEQDMRHLAFETEFDAALSLFSAWGYFDDAQNQQVLARIAHALRPGGRFVMEVVHRDWLMTVFTAKDWIELGDGSFVVVERVFDPITGTNEVTHRWRTPTGEQRERQHQIRIYTATELDHMLRAVGLTPVAWHNGFSLQPFTTGSSRLLVVAERSG